MSRFSLYRASFSAAHSGGASHTAASTRLHGHDFTVDVEAALGETQALAEALDLVATQLDGRTLEDMMPGASTDPLGVASWIMEHLALTHQSITRVTVASRGHHGSVTREARRTT